jgi:hypothetical protein
VTDSKTGALVIIVLYFIGMTLLIAYLLGAT